MREKVVKVEYSMDKKYRYEVVDREDGTFQVWAEIKIVDDMDEDVFFYEDIKDYAHITDTIDNAIKIGEEMLRNLI